MGYYNDRHGFTFLTETTQRRWRKAQLGAIGALIGHWSMPRQPPALVTLPTGAGKSAVAIAAPYLIGARRVLVVVPSRDLRKQTVEAFRHQDVLRRVGALTGDSDPSVVELSGLAADWSPLYDADVVVALPNAVSPSYYTDTAEPPTDLFDLVIIDEAHHSPAPTWRAILDHFGDADALLLTATPRRRDRQPLPGAELYHYPVRLALENGFYKPVEPVILDLPPAPTQEAVDRMIATEALKVIAAPEHTTSSIMIRARTRKRAGDLAELYRTLGVDVETLHSGMGDRARETLVTRIRAGECRAVAVVNMLGEGFDLPRLRIAAYHDKHRSLTATTQFLGRLARVDSEYQQPSVLIAAQDIDVHPQLLGAVRELYAEDADWVQVLPGLIDDEIAEAKADRAYAASFAVAPPNLALDAVTPVCSVVLFEVDTQSGFEPEIATGTVPEELAEGKRLNGRTIIYSSVNPTNTSLVIVTTATNRPRWHATNPGLDAPTYDLHLVTWLRSPHIDEPHLLLINTNDGTVRNQLRVAVGGALHARSVDPRRLQDAFDALDRISVSSVGVRNTYRGSVGVPSYTMFAGSGVDRGLRAADTDRRALGHAIAQVGSGRGAFSAGVATGKSKYWEGRYLSLRNYEGFAADLGSRFWLPTVAAAGRLLPNVTRGRRLTTFPEADVAVIEHSPSIRNMDWRTLDGVPIEDLELGVDPAQERTAERLPVLAVDPAKPDASIWQGYQDPDGEFHCAGQSLDIRMGFYGSIVPLEALLSAKPPTIFFLDGQTSIGPVLYESRGKRTTLPSVNYQWLGWDDVNLTAETKKKAEEKKLGRSIHEELERYLQEQPKRARHRWILCNDGAREIADYVVIEVDPGRQVTLSLWHAKAAEGAVAGVRVNDMQTVTQQAIKSRGYITDPGFWRLLGARLAGRDSPKITIVEGSRRLLRILCGEDSDHPSWGFASRPPIAVGRIAIAQPGLSLNMLRTNLQDSTPTIAAKQIREFLTVLDDAVSPIAEIELLTSE